MKYSEFEDTFVRKLKKEKIQVTVLERARGLAFKEVVNDSAFYNSLKAKGFSNQVQKCNCCNAKLVNKWDIQEIWMMPCDHIFHARCIAKSDGQCPICFNSLEILRK